MSDDDRAPQENPTKDQSDWVTGDEPMTGPQRSYLGTLAQEPGNRSARTPDQGAGPRTDRRTAADHRAGRLMVTADDVRRLLAAEGDSVLVMVEGRVDVVAPAELDTDPYRGALQIITREELVDGAGGEQLSEREAAKKQASELDSAVSELGG